LRRIKIGIIGCGVISSYYLRNINKKFKNIEVLACADSVMKNAEAISKEFGIPKFLSVDELLNDPEIEIVLNLTIPKAHSDICMAALNAGKNVYVEKPFALTREDGLKVLDLAKVKGLLVGCAPDTFLGAGLQTCRKLIDDGWIGKPIAATGFMTCHGPEDWHPNPEFYYLAGGGPMFDMGPYYLTAMISLMGPVKRVTASASMSFTERIVTSIPKYGQKIHVEVPTHIAGIMDFECGAVGNLITSFDIWNSKLPKIEIYGTEGTLYVPDPNTFGGPVSVQRNGADKISEIPLTHLNSEESRGIGLADMCDAILTGKRHRANGDMAYHVLDIMQGFHDSSSEGKHYYLKSTCDLPEPLQTGDISKAR